MKFAHFSHIWAKPGLSPHQRYEELWRELQLCDELGFDYGFCVEHHFRPDESWMSSPSLYAIGAGARTRRLRWSLDLLLIWFAYNTAGLLRRFDLHVGIAGVEQAVREIGQGFAPSDFLKFRELVRTEVPLQPGKPAGQGGEGISVDPALRHVV